MEKFVQCYCLAPKIYQLGNHRLPLGRLVERLKNNSTNFFPHFPLALFYSIYLRVYSPIRISDFLLNSRTFYGRIFGSFGLFDVVLSSFGFSSFGLFT